MQHTFPEIDITRQFPAAPERYPLLEVRWWGFLRGDAYVNPFHDLLHALSRTTHPAVARRGGKTRSVSFEQQQLVVHSPGGRKERIPYHTLAELKLFYQQMMAGAGSAGRYMAGYYLTLELKEASGYRSIHLGVGYSQYLDLLTFLYGHRVIFREYMNGLRSYLADNHVPYRKVQEIKQKHGVPW